MYQSMLKNLNVEWCWNHSVSDIKKMGHQTECQRSVANHTINYTIEISHPETDRHTTDRHTDNHTHTHTHTHTLK